MLADHEASVLVVEHREREDPLGERVDAPGAVAAQHVRERELGVGRRDPRRVEPHRRAAVGRLDAPARLYEKAPTADLLDENPGQTDESNLGLVYADLDEYLEGGDVATEVAEAIEARYQATEHKRQVPLSMFDDWWRASAVYTPGNH